MGSATWEQVRARRLDRGSLTTRETSDRMVAVAHELGGIHAQVQASAELQFAARVDEIVQADVRSALWEQRSLVKAWTVRGTLHLHPAGELPLWHAARRAVAKASNEGGLEAWRDPAGVLHPPLTGDEVKAISVAIWEALDGRCLLRAQLVQEVGKRIGPHARRRMLSGFAFFLGELCQGPPRGARVTFVRPDQWIEGWREMDAQDALFEVCRRYLYAYGPARPSAFREWFGSGMFQVADAQAVFDSLGHELEEIDVEGRRAYVLAGDIGFPEMQQSVRLLPEYDAYVMGFRERERLVPEAVRDLITAHLRGRYEGPAGVRLVLVDGIAAGLWERKRHGKRIELRVTLARRLASAQRAELRREAKRIGGFLGLEPVVRID